MAVLAHRGALGAVGAEIERAVEARLLADPDAVLDLGDHRAADRAVGADRLDLLDRAGRGLGLRLGLGDHAAAGQRGGGEAAGGQAGAAEEGATVEHAAGEPGQGLRHPRAVEGSAGLLSQHDGSPLGADDASRRTAQKRASS